MYDLYSTPHCLPTAYRCGRGAAPRTESLFKYVNDVMGAKQKAIIVPGGLRVVARSTTSCGKGGMAVGYCLTPTSRRAMVNGAGAPNR